MRTNIVTDIDSYIIQFPLTTQAKLKQLRTIINQVAKGAEELISYQMPAFKLNGVLVYFAAYKNHIGFYPTSSGISNFKDELSAFKWSKGAIQFPLDKPLPVTLIKKITKFKVQENKIKASIKKTRKVSLVKK